MMRRADCVYDASTWQSLLDRGLGRGEIEVEQFLTCERVKDLGRF